MIAAFFHELRKNSRRAEPLSVRQIWRMMSLLQCLSVVLKMWSKPGILLFRRLQMMSLNLSLGGGWWEGICNKFPINLEKGRVLSIVCLKRAQKVEPLFFAVGRNKISNCEI